MMAEALPMAEWNILLVEDNPNDVFFTLEGFKEAGVKANISQVNNGLECLDYLKRKGKYTDSVSPDLILLDINMPLMDGRQVMDSLTHDADLCQFPVVVLTTSSREEDIQTMYRLRCNAYLVKPFDFDAFVEVIRSLEQFWFGKAALPSRPSKPND